MKMLTMTNLLTECLIQLTTLCCIVFFFSSRRRHTRSDRDWSSDVCSSDLQQFAHCGKPRCRKCREGMGHGPYWYAYQTENGITTRTYVGKHLPPEAQAMIEARSEERRVGKECRSRWSPYH